MEVHGGMESDVHVEVKEREMQGMRGRRGVIEWSRLLPLTVRFHARVRVLVALAF